MGTIYFDHAATTPIDEGVLELLTTRSRDIIGNPSSTHSLGQAARVEIENARNSIAQLLKVRSSEIYFTSGATEAINLIFHGIAIGDIDRFIVSPLEHHAVLHSIKNVAPTIPIEYVRHNPKGEIDIPHLEALLSNSKRACVAIMAVNNEIGNINPIAQIGNLCKNHGALFFSDMVQAVGKTPFDLESVDFASFSAHKFYGPKGIGFAYIRSGNKITKLIHGGSQEQNMRAGTENLPSIVAMAKALSLIFDHFEEHKKHLFALKTYFVSELKSNFPTVVFNGTSELNGVSSIVNFSFPDFSEMSMLHILLDMNGICISQGSACSSGAVHRSHVITALNNDIDQAIRVSFGICNTREEIDTCIRVLKNCISK
jgi:cysteine desulfurase